MSIKTTHCLGIIGMIVLTFGATGCRSVNQGFTPASCVRNASEYDAMPTEKINFLTLRRSPPNDYILDSGDTLGIYVQGITGDKETPPPVHFPEDEGMQPALGYPVPIRDDGMISLPLINPIKVAGLTLGQAEARIRDAYTQDKQILLKGNDKIIVTLMRRRTYNILVVREDISDNRTFAFRKNELFVDENQQGQTFSIELPAYENDVLHALSETGGMPGESALNEIIVMREGAAKFDQANVDNGGIVQAVMQDEFSPTMSGANTVRIPIESSDGSFPVLNESDITLNDGDVVYIKGRQRDVFYTGGLLEGGRYPLPRDYEIDVLEAISMAGGSSASTAGSNTGAGLRGGSVMPATLVKIIRKEGAEMRTIEVDLRCAQVDSRQRVIIQPGDFISLEYRKGELAVNSLVSIFQFGGIFRLFD